MGNILRLWRRIGTKLYLALGFAVLLTLISSAVGVFYFEQSSAASYQVRTESVPVLEASWAAAREVERLKALGSRSLGGTVGEGEVDDSLMRLEAELAQAAMAPAMTERVELVQDRAFTLAAVIDNLALAKTAVEDGIASEAMMRAGLASESSPATPLHSQMLTAESQAQLEELWQELVATPGLGAETAELGRQVFTVRGQQLALESRVAELSDQVGPVTQELDGALESLLAEARANSSQTLQSSSERVEQGRALLAAISLVSMGAATLAAWLLVGNQLVRPLNRLSERMRGMAGGDLETPVPGVGRDEIGELANALEVFRQQALEVQRLNLVEKLYGELQAANEELQRMQDRIVAQEKLAALGELVSGVAHEISNPLNFVQNFAEVSVEMHEELAGILKSYRDSMTEDDQTTVEELEEDLADSLNRIRTNGGRALAIVERMRGLGVVGGELTLANLNANLHSAVDVGVEAFQAQWPDMKIDVEFDLDPAVGDVMLVEGDFGEAIINLVSNACYALWVKQSESPEAGYQPSLKVTTEVTGDGVEVRLRDNGTGIADDVLSHIFNPFFSTREGTPGAGLGLPIAADVVRRAGGVMTVDTVHGEYAEFTISLPKSEPQEGEPETGAT